jgi:hypothetical protein
MNSEGETSDIHGLSSVQVDTFGDLLPPLYQIKESA